MLHWRLPRLHRPFFLTSSSVHTRSLHVQKIYIYIYICFGRLWCSSYLLTYFLSLSPLCVCASIQSWSKIGYLPILVHESCRSAGDSATLLLLLPRNPGIKRRPPVNRRPMNPPGIQRRKWIVVKLVKLRIHYQNQYRIKVDFCRWVKKDFFVIKILIVTNPHWISIACNQRKKKKVDYLGCTEKGLVSWAMYFIGISVCS
jgi:hypothetical protein